ncbi:MAG: multicopper oxidase domain-containing protein [Actinomycetota bacterium]|nr:multicopper oxidase domain-containing protein [Actinomycetota bacterium]
MGLGQTLVVPEMLGAVKGLHARTAMRIGVALIAGSALVGALASCGTSSSASSDNPSHQTRAYFIAADEQPWDYAPRHTNAITGKPFDATADTFVKQGPDRIGSRYLKALYRQYTDARFTTLLPRPASQAYLGDLGPIIRAEVGDTIQVTFRNNTRFPESMHPHGVFYQAASEGAVYNNGIPEKDKPGDSVAPGHTFTYTWEVPERAGPGPSDPSSIMWMYHGHVDEIADTYAGLIGPMIITRAGQANPDGSPKDVDKEFVANFMVANENQSPYLSANIAKYASNPKSVNRDDDDFIESNLMHSINGYVFGNQPMMTMTQGQHVRWYVMAMGTEVDLHTPHWHGNTLTSMGMRTDTISLLPGAMITADMTPDNAGIWLFHCHVNDHITAGMLTRYQVLPSSNAPPTESTAPAHTSGG